jgi:hypothetical protein
MYCRHAKKEKEKTLNVNYEVKSIADWFSS